MAGDVGSSFLGFTVKDAEPKFISIVSRVSRDKDTRQTCLATKTLTYLFLAIHMFLMGRKQTCLVTETLTLPVYDLNFKFDDLS